MRHLVQPKTAKTCGQHCLAMLAGVSIAEAVRAVGHRGSTKPDDLLRAALFLGLKPAWPLWATPLRGESFPANCLIRMRAPRRKRFHWCCYVDGVYHDPAEPEAGTLGRNFLVVAWMQMAR